MFTRNEVIMLTTLFLLCIFAVSARAACIDVLLKQSTMIVDEVQATHCVMNKRLILTEKFEKLQQQRVKK